MRKTILIFTIVVALAAWLFTMGTAVAAKPTPTSKPTATPKPTSTPAVQHVTNPAYCYECLKGQGGGPGWEGICIANSDGSQMERVMLATKTRFNGPEPRWSKDGQSIYFTAWDNGPRKFFRIDKNTDGSWTSPVAVCDPALQLCPSGRFVFSTDGRKILWGIDGSPWAYQYGVWDIATPGCTPQMTEFEIMHGFMGFGPDTDPDIDGFQGELVFVLDKEPYFYDICTMGATEDGCGLTFQEPPIKRTDTDYSIKAPSWSPDGQWIAAVNIGKGLELWDTDTWTMVLKLLPIADYWNGYEASWSRDSRYVTLEYQGDIYRIKVDGSDLTNVTGRWGLGESLVDWNPAWVPDLP